MKLMILRATGIISLGIAGINVLLNEWKKPKQSLNRELHVYSSQFLYPKAGKGQR